MIEPIDQDIIHQYILLQYLERVLNRDQKAIAASQVKFQRPFEQFFNTQLKLIVEQKRDLKNRMVKRGLKILKEEQVDDFATEFHYLCRGYQSVFRYWNVALKNQVEDLYFKMLNVEKPS
jgi:hypothetical protein